MLRSINFERQLARHCGLAVMGTGCDGDTAQLRRGCNKVLTVGTEGKKNATVYGHVDGAALAGHRLHLCVADTVMPNQELSIGECLCNLVSVAVA